jgi:hypothetical protein
MNKKNFLIALAFALKALALFAAYMGSFFWYGLAMYFVGFLAASVMLTKIEEQDDDSN